MLQRGVVGRRRNWRQSGRLKGEGATAVPRGGGGCRDGGGLVHHGLQRRLHCWKGGIVVVVKRNVRIRICRDGSAKNSTGVQVVDSELGQGLKGGEQKGVQLQRHAKVLNGALPAMGFAANFSQQGQSGGTVGHGARLWTTNFENINQEEKEAASATNPAEHCKNNK